MKIKEYINNFKNSSIVQDALGKIRPTWNVIKNGGGYKILIISLIITAIFMPIKAIISFLSKILLGGAGLLTFSSITDIIQSIFNGYYYYDSGYLVMAIILTIVSRILSIIAFIITTFVVSNANFRAFKILAEEERVVSIGEYFSLAFKDLIPYSWKLFLNVILPLFVIEVAGKLINFIPYIRGIAFANLLISILSFALIFRFFAMMINIDHEKAVLDFSAYWLTFAVIVYLIKIITSLSILITLFEMIFVLYTLLLLTGSKYYYGEQ